MSKPKLPSLIDLLLLDPNAIVDAVDGIFKAVNELTLGKRGVVTSFPLPFVEGAVARELKGRMRCLFAVLCYKCTHFDLYYSQLQSWIV